MITEKLLHFIWRYGYYNYADLRSAEGNIIELIKTGQLNSNQGPDFLNAQIRIDDTIWAGHVELHVRSSEWESHGHDSDPNYKNVILHVVWTHDSPVNHGFPTLELQDRIPNHLLSKYGMLMQSPDFIPCQKHLKQVSSLIWISWKQRLAVERMQTKCRNISRLLAEANYHWEEVFWWMIAKNFGYRVNADAFVTIARSIPLNLLAKHRSNLRQLESLLLGQSGLLNQEFTEKYPLMLKKEYHFLKVKYKLKPVFVRLHFLRMRPANFPTVRLAQLASLISGTHQLFTIIREATELKRVIELFKTRPSDYWSCHYRFDEPIACKEKRPGDDMIRLIIINTVIPFLFAYGKYKDDQVLIERAMRWLEELPSENNVVIRNFKVIGIDSRHALESQALLELKNEYCNERRCLECSIGNNLLKTATTS